MSYVKRTTSNVGQVLSILLFIARQVKIRRWEFKAYNGSEGIWVCNRPCLWVFNKPCLSTGVAVKNNMLDIS